MLAETSSLTAELPTDCFVPFRPAPKAKRIDRDKLMSRMLADHEGYLHTVANRLCSGLGLAEAADIVQQTCLQAWRKRSTFDVERCPKAWLVQILRNEYYQIVRRGSYSVSAESEQIPRTLQDPFDTGSTIDAISVTQALKTLSQERREAVVLVLVFGFTYEEAAKFVGCAAGTMKSRVSRGRSDLAELL